MSKYNLLYGYLKDSKKSKVTLSFDEIEKILGFKLPNSAKQYQEWWANEDVNTTMHSHCKSWQNAGYKQIELFLDKDFDVNKSHVTFERVDY